MANGTILKYADGTDTGWVTPSKTSGAVYSSGSVQYRRIGNTVTVIGTDLILPENGGLIIAMDAGYWPAVNTTCPVALEYPNYKPVAIARIYSSTGLLSIPKFTNSSGTVTDPLDTTHKHSFTMIYFL